LRVTDRRLRDNLNEKALVAEGGQGVILGKKSSSGSRDSSAALEKARGEKNRITEKIIPFLNTRKNMENEKKRNLAAIALGGKKCDLCARRGDRPPQKGPLWPLTVVKPTWRYVGK